jgi:hypothetical protein
MSEQTQRYREVRRALEELVANYPLDYPIDAYVAACYYLSEHCEDCGARLRDNTLSVGDERGQTLPDAADAYGGDSTVCTDCLARRRHTSV